VSLSGCIGAEPVSTSDPIDLTDEQLAQSILDQSWAEYSARFPDVQRPRIERVRFITGDEWPTVISDCMHSEGFGQVGLNVFEDGIDFGVVPAEQEAAFELARYVCAARFPLNPKLQRPLSDDQLFRLYDYYVGDHTACLESLGYTIPEPPTKQVFIETHLATPWLPIYFAAPQARARGIDAIVEMIKSCPQQPDGFWD